jgi:hypothetical protein
MVDIDGMRGLGQMSTIRLLLPIIMAAHRSAAGARDRPVRGASLILPGGEPAPNLTPPALPSRKVDPDGRTWVARFGSDGGSGARAPAAARSPIRCAAASTSAGRQRVDMRANIAEYLRPFSVGWTAVVSAGGYRLQARVSVVTGVEASRGRHAGT